MLRRIFAAILLSAVVFTYTTAVEGSALIGASGSSLSSAGNHPAIAWAQAGFARRQPVAGGFGNPVRGPMTKCHTGRSDGGVLQSKGARKSPSLFTGGLLCVAPGSTGLLPVLEWAISDDASPGRVLHGRLTGGTRSARGPPRCGL